MDYTGMRSSPLLQRYLLGRWSALLTGLILCLWCTAPVLAAETQRAGVGLQVVPTVTGQLVVLGVLDKSPAHAAGLQPGDLLVAIDGTPLQGSKFETVVKKHLWGKAGSKVKITYLRPGVAGEQQLSLLRAELPKNARQRLKIKMLEPEAAGGQGADHVK